MAPVVTDNRDRTRFEIHVDGELAGFADYRLRDSTIVFTHAEVGDEHEGQGLGSRLAAESLDAARTAGLAVEPACPFYVDFIRRHPDYLGLVPEQQRGDLGL